MLSLHFLDSGDGWERRNGVVCSFASGFSQELHTGCLFLPSIPSWGGLLCYPEKLCQINPFPFPPLVFTLKSCKRVSKLCGTINTVVFCWVPLRLKRSKWGGGIFTTPIWPKTGGGCVCVQNELVAWGSQTLFARRPMRQLKLSLCNLIFAVVNK